MEFIFSEKELSNKSRIQLKRLIEHIITRQINKIRLMAFLAIINFSIFKFEGVIILDFALLLNK